MESFKDSKDRVWEVGVNITSIKRVKALTGIDLLSVLDGELVPELMANPMTLCDVVYAICKPQAEAKGISDEEFGEALAGDAIELATEALLADLVSFCPSPRDRANLGQVLTKTKKMMDRARDLVETKLNSGDLERAADEQMAKAMGAGPHGLSSGSVQGSSESTPAG